MFKRKQIKSNITKEYWLTVSLQISTSKYCYDDYLWVVALTPNIYNPDYGFSEGKMFHKETSNVFEICK